ncbi:cytochrome c3 family protein [Desertivirga arenae]|uniref:cytochrome c3 family protein n=1 Tax=Desertivirga arenae TaxID=2810309 RepID=UPI001A97855F|nr:cytochrome c3 family protein [Pedobacter sp. SYSU D00823]
MRSISLVFRRIAQSLLLVSTLSFGFQQANAQAPAGGAAPAASSGGGDAAAGAALFKQKCTSCHALDRQVVGPALKGINGKHSKEWLHKWIKNSQALVASGDAEAVKVFNEYNKTVMTPFPELSDADVDNILAYVEVGETAKPGGEAGAAAGTGAEGEAKKEGISNLMLGGLILIVVVALLVIVVLNRVIKTLDRIILQKQGVLPEGEVLEESTAVRFRRLAKNKKFVFFVIILLVALFGSLGWKAMWNTGVHTGYQPTQPIKYSHQLHAGTLKIDCQYCHFSAYKSKNAAIPSLNVCMNCHNYVTASDKYNGEISPEISKIYKALDYDPQTKKYGNNPKPIQWIRVHNLPDFAYFNHSQHVTVAGVRCQECHGPIQTMPEVYQYSPLTMKWCINCHRTREVNSKGNAYYDKVLKVHDQLKKGEKVTPAVLGGLECGKCHY